MSNFICKRRCRWWVWLIVGLLVGAVIGGLLCRKVRKGEVELRVDTLVLAQYPVEPQEQAGRALPTVDTLWRIGKVTLSSWSIQYVEHRYDAVKVIAVKPEDDSSLVRSTTYYAPDGFRLYFEDDSLRLDTFPRSRVATPPPSKKRWLRLSGLGELDTQDGLGVGVEVSAWRIVRLQGLVGVGRVCYEAGGQGWPANEYAPWLRLRFQIAIP